MKKTVKEFKISKEKNFNDWFNSVVKRSDLVDQDYGAKGFVVKKPMTMMIVETIRNMYEAEYKNTGHLPVHFPTVVPEKNFEKEKDHVEGFAPNVFWVTEAGAEGKKLEERLALKPTGETAIYPSYSKWVRSYRDLPIKYYQFGTVFRYETKATKPYMREREFLWFESHNVYETKKEMKAQIKEDLKITEKIVHQKLGVPFLYVKRPQWDKFPGADNTYVADVPLVNGHVVQIASTHELGQGFAKAFDIKFTDKNEKVKYAWQTCYGPGIARMVASLVCVHGDDKGLVLPFEVAATQIVIIPILFGKNNEKVLKKGIELKKKLKKFRTVFDNSDASPGEKYNEWELKGVPIRIEIGPREVENKELTLVRRDTKEKIKIKEKDLLIEINKLKKDILQNIKKTAEKLMESKIVTAENYKDIVKKLKEGKIVKAPFCSTDFEGEDCADKIKEDSSALVRGTALNVKDKLNKNSKCIVCGRPAKELVYIAKDY